MTDRETLAAVAKGYNELMELQNRQRETMALALRAISSRIQSRNINHRVEGIAALRTLIDFLEKEGK